MQVEEGEEGEGEHPSDEEEKRGVLPGWAWLAPLRRGEVEGFARGAENALVPRRAAPPLLDRRAACSFLALASSPHWARSRRRVVVNGSVVPAHHPDGGSVGAVHPAQRAAHAGCAPTPPLQLSLLAGGAGGDHCCVAVVVLSRRTEAAPLLAPCRPRLALLVAGAAVGGGGKPWDEGRGRGRVWRARRWGCR